MLPTRVVAPITVTCSIWSRTVRAPGPLPSTTSSAKSSMAGYRISSTTWLSRWISSMNSTSPLPRLVRTAARSPARSMAGPEVGRICGPISAATMLASVVLPSPGGPYSSTWSTGSSRWREHATRRGGDERLPAARGDDLVDQSRTEELVTEQNHRSAHLVADRIEAEAQRRAQSPFGERVAHPVQARIVVVRRTGQPDRDNHRHWPQARCDGGIDDMFQQRAPVQHGELLRAAESARGAGPQDHRADRLLCCHRSIYCAKCAPDTATPTSWHATGSGS